MAERVNVKALRQRLGMNREAFAEYVHSHPRTVRRWENRESEPSPMASAHLARLADEAETESATRRKPLRVED